MAYAVIDDGGHVFIESSRLPLYWRRDIALSAARDFGGVRPLKVKRVLVSDRWLKRKRKAV
jgi:hypothetical protein